jgi:hypothetical protein
MLTRLSLVQLEELKGKLEADTCKNIEVTTLRQLATQNLDFAANLEFRYFTDYERLELFLVQRDLYECCDKQILNSFKNFYGYYSAWGLRPDLLDLPLFLLRPTVV